MVTFPDIHAALGITREIWGGDHEAIEEFVE